MASIMSLGREVLDAYPLSKDVFVPALYKAFEESDVNLINDLDSAIKELNPRFAVTEISLIREWVAGHVEGSNADHAMQVEKVGKMALELEQDEYQLMAKKILQDLDLHQVWVQKNRSVEAQLHHARQGYKRHR